MALEDSRSPHPIGGAYGIALDCGPVGTHRFGRISANAEAWTLEVQHLTEEAISALEAPSGDDSILGVNVSDEQATVPFDRAKIQLDRRQRVMTLSHPRRVDPEEFAHPLLAPAGIIIAYWRGFVSLHAGAVIIDGRAWGLLADRSHGKSTTTAALAQAGFTILTDDLLVIDDDLMAHSGPRCVDLRDTSAERFPTAFAMPPTTGRSRFRLPIGPAPARVPLAGFIRLAWADETVLVPVKPVDRLPMIASALSFHGDMANPKLTLDLLSLPMWILKRPQQLSSLRPSIEAIAALGGA